MAARARTGQGKTRAGQGKERQGLGKARQGQGKGKARQGQRQGKAKHGKGKEGKGKTSKQGHGKHVQGTWVEVAKGSSMAVTTSKVVGVTSQVVEPCKDNTKSSGLEVLACMQGANTTLGSWGCQLHM